MVLGPAPVLMRWPVFLLPGLLLPQGRGEGEVGHNQQSQMCRWPEVLLLVGECSEEPVLILYAKKTELLSSAAKFVQRQCTCTCCYVASCTDDLRTTKHYGSYVLIWQDMLKPLTWEVYDDAPLRWRQLRGLLSWLKNLSEEVEIEKNKTSYIVEKPCLTLELLDSEES